MSYELQLWAIIPTTADIINHLYECLKSLLIYLHKYIGDLGVRQGFKMGNILLFSLINIVYHQLMCAEFNVAMRY